MTTQTTCSSVNVHTLRDDNANSVMGTGLYRDAAAFLKMNPNKTIWHHG